MGITGDDLARIQQIAIQARRRSVDVAAARGYELPDGAYVVNGLHTGEWHARQGLMCRYCGGADCPGIYGGRCGIDDVDATQCEACSTHVNHTFESSGAETPGISYGYDRFGYNWGGGDCGCAALPPHPENAAMFEGQRALAVSGTGDYAWQFEPEIWSHLALGVGSSAYRLPPVDVPERTVAKIFHRGVLTVMVIVEEDEVECCEEIVGFTLGALMAEAATGTRLHEDHRPPTRSVDHRRERAAPGGQYPEPIGL